MIQEHTGNVLDIKKGIIVHGCNAHGVMGSGIAAQIRKKWPECYEVYRKEYEKGDNYLALGDVILYTADPGLVIANAITQRDFGSDPEKVYVNYNAVYSAFVTVRSVARWLDLPVHFPLIGCGLANGNWGKVSASIENAIPDDIEKHLWLLPDAAIMNRK